MVSDRSSSCPMAIGGVSLEQISGRMAFTALLRDQERALQLVCMEMAQLAKNSVVQGTRTYAVLPPSNPNAQRARQLRWYSNGTFKTWEVIEPSLAQLPAPIRRHYETVARRFKELNALSSMLYASTRRLQEHLKSIA